MGPTLTVMCAGLMRLTTASTLLALQMNKTMPALEWYHGSPMAQLGLILWLESLGRLVNQSLSVIGMQPLWSHVPVELRLKARVFNDVMGSRIGNAIAALLSDLSITEHISWLSSVDTCVLLAWITALLWVLFAYRTGSLMTKAQREQTNRIPRSDLTKKIQ
jgi:hypothetical protein